MMIGIREHGIRASTDIIYRMFDENI